MNKNERKFASRYSNVFVENCIRNTKIAFERKISIKLLLAEYKIYIYVQILYEIPSRFLQRTFYNAPKNNPASNHSTLPPAGTAVRCSDDTRVMAARVEGTRRGTEGRNPVREARFVHGFTRRLITYSSFFLFFFALFLRHSGLVRRVCRVHDSFAFFFFFFFWRHVVVACTPPVCRRG